jgi:glutamine cyclotransferase
MRDGRALQGPARLPMRHCQWWLKLLCIVALAAACAPTSTGVATPSPTGAIGDVPLPLTPTSQPAAPSPAARPPPPAKPSPRAREATPVYGYRVVNEYPHDPNAFAQGLVYEGTGLTNGRSSLRQVALETGQVLKIHKLEPAYFGEGIAVVGDRIWQLTWQNHVAFLYDKETLAQLDTVQYPTEGWGLTYDGERLIMSDGTATLYFRDPDSFEVLDQITVYDEQGAVDRLNELEYIDGQVFANVWMTNRVAIIDPVTGRVNAWLDLAGLLDLSDLQSEVDVLNGIAYDAAGERLFVTGTWWPSLLEIEIVDDGGTSSSPSASPQ